MLVIKILQLVKKKLQYSYNNQDPKIFLTILYYIKLKFSDHLNYYMYVQKYHHKHNQMLSMFIYEMHLLFNFCRTFL